MSLLSEYKNCIIIIIITIILGYFLGLSVSTVVDYRLKDAIIKFPRQKNNIVVKLDNEQIEKFVNKKKTKTNRYKSKKTKTNKSKSKKTKIEKFENYDCKPKNLKKYNLKVKPTIDNNVFKAWDNFSRDLKIPDPNIKIYSKNFKKNSKIEKNNIYKAANEEDTDQQFQNLIVKHKSNLKKNKNKTK